MQSHVPAHFSQLHMEHELDASEALSHKILKLVRDTLVLKMPYFNRAILKMPEWYYIPEDFSGWLDKENRPTIPPGLGTNGEMLFVNPDAMIEGYRENPNRIVHTYLHLLLHCIYRHPFHYESLDMDLWDMASDIAVENKLLELGLRETRMPDDSYCRTELEELENQIGSLTAERIYHHLREDSELREVWTKRASRYHYDLHEFWMTAGREGNGEAKQDGRMIMTNPDTEEEWKKIGGQTRLSISNQEINMGLSPNSLTSLISDVNRDEKDYTEFLRSFAKIIEEIHIDPDAFDYIYYYYGMEMYGNMPLIEPLEYREAPKIEDFVIAIDTSGSCQGNAVRAFLNKTYSILKNTEVFARRMNLHIIQCDCEIQKDITIHDQEEFDRYMEEIEIQGSGGTDFRPVFTYVEELMASGKLSKLRGLIYLTDGMGMYPEKEPRFQTAFILKSTSGQYPEIPNWAKEYQLQDKDMRSMGMKEVYYRQGLIS